MRQFIVALVLLVSTGATSASAEDCFRRLLARGGSRIIRVEVWVNRHAVHRQIDVMVVPSAPLETEADPPDWDASSSRLLDGEREKALHVFEFKGPPAGRYEVIVIVSGGGQQAVKRTHVLTSF